MAKIILQPNADQLEALLKSDGEQVWLDLRESIVQQFAARHLKSVVATPVMENAIKAIAEIARKEVEESIGHVNFSGRLNLNTNLNPRFQAALKDFIDQTSKRLADSVYRSIDQRVDEEIERVTASIMHSIDAKLNYAVDVRIKLELKARLDAAIKAIS